jgi:hypothetical protein
MGVTTRTAAAAAVASAASSRTNDASYCQDINCDAPEDFKVEAASKTLISITSGRIVFCNTERSAVLMGSWSHTTKNML